MNHDPLAQLSAWHDEARASGAPEPDAAALATTTHAGRPSVRFVLVRAVRDGVLQFYTNYESRKGHELDANPFAAVAFHWPSLGRQVRVEGPVTRLDAANSDAYFAARPRGSRLSALASPQSQPIVSLDELRERRREVERLYEGQDVPRPPHWGGYGLRAERIEFWVAGADRLHERRFFELDPGGWRATLLAP